MNTYNLLVCVFPLLRRFETIAALLMQSIYQTPNFDRSGKLEYQGVKEFHMLARIGCFKNYGFQSF